LLFAARSLLYTFTRGSTNSLDGQRRMNRLTDYVKTIEAAEILGVSLEYAPQMYGFGCDIHAHEPDKWLLNFPSH
jgi:hypothetical protein